MKKEGEVITWWETAYHMSRTLVRPPAQKEVDNLNSRLVKEM